MGLRNILVADGVRLHYLPLDKFKTNFMSVSFAAPLEAGTNAMNSLIPNILLRGSEKYDTSRTHCLLPARGSNSKQSNRASMKSRMQS